MESPQKIKELDLDSKEFHDDEFIGDLAAFFDLLAKFDYQDKQNEKLALNSDLLASAPRESGLDSNSING